MTFKTNLKNIFLVVFATLILSACSTGKKSGNMDGDVYTGKETVKYLASGVPDRVFFATNKSSLTTASRATLRKQANYLRKNKSLNVTIEGHASSDGSDTYNQALSERRANAVKAYLVGKGIDASRINTIGFGETKPIDNNDTAKGRRINRRAQIERRAEIKVN